MADNAPVDLELIPDWDLGVLVTEPGRRPAANVPVSLLRQYEGQTPFREGKVFTTGDGHARFDHAGAFLLQSSEWIDRYKTPCIWMIQVDLCVADPDREILDPLRAPATTPRLELPPTGSLLVEAVDANGHATPLEGPVWIRRADDHRAPRRRRKDADRSDRG